MLRESGGVWSHAPTITWVAYLPEHPVDLGVGALEKRARPVDRRAILAKKFDLMTSRKTNLACR